MITIEVSGPRKEVEATAKQIITLLQTSGKVVKVFDASIATPPTSDMVGPSCNVMVIKQPEAA